MHGLGKKLRGSGGITWTMWLGVNDTEEEGENSWTNRTSDAEICHPKPKNVRKGHPGVHGGFSCN